MNKYAWLRNELQWSVLPGRDESEEHAAKPAYSFVTWAVRVFLEFRQGRGDAVRRHLKKLCFTPCKTKRILYLHPPLYEK